MKKSPTRTVRGALWGALAVSLATTALIAVPADRAVAAFGGIIGMQQWGSAGWDEPIVLRIDAAGGLYTGGGTGGALAGTNKGGEDAFIAKLSPTGVRLWTRQIGTPLLDETNDVVPIAHGGVYAGGMQGDWACPDPGHPDQCRRGWLARLSATGTVSWRRWLNWQGLDTVLGLGGEPVGFNVRAMALDGAGNVLVAVRTEPTDRFGEVFLLRYTPDGGLLWHTKVPGGATDVREHGVAIDASGNFYVIGTHGSDTSKSTGFIAKYRADDTLAWLNPIVATGATVSVDGLAVDTLGNVYAGGATDGSLFVPNRGDSDIWVMALDPEGNPRWQQQLGTTVYDDMWDLTIDAAGDVYVTGGTFGALAGANRGGEDIWTAKLRGSTGRWLGGRQIGTPKDEYGTAVVVSGTTLYLIGDTEGALAGTNRGDEDAVLIRLTTR